MTIESVGREPPTISSAVFADFGLGIMVSQQLIKPFWIARPGVRVEIELFERVAVEISIGFRMSV
jgi:hypothetical protein